MELELASCLQQNVITKPALGSLRLLLAAVFKSQRQSWAINRLRDSPCKGSCESRTYFSATHTQHHLTEKLAPEMMLGPSVPQAWDGSGFNHATDPAALQTLHHLRWCWVCRTLGTTTQLGTWATIISGPGHTWTQHHLRWCKACRAAGSTAWLDSAASQGVLGPTMPWTQQLCKLCTYWDAAGSISCLGPWLGCQLLPKTCPKTLSATESWLQSSMP